MSTINQIQLPNGSTYDFEDTAAREEVSSKADKTLATASSNGLMSASDKSKLDGIGAGSNVKSVNGKTGAVTISKADVGLDNVDNTSDADKPYYKLIGETATNTNKVGHFNFNDASRSLYKIKNFYTASVEGDYFYLAHKKSDYTITATKHFSHTDDLFTANLSSDCDCRIATNLISESDPAILTIVRKNAFEASKQLNLTLIFYEDMGLQSNARLKHWKLEIMHGQEWLTVFERTNVSDSINCLWCGLNAKDNWVYLSIKGIRITIYAATPCSTQSWAFGYNQLRIAGMRLLESRPLFSPAEALGALDVAGGTVYGETKFQGGISATSYSGATATSSADGLMSKDDKAKLDTLLTKLYPVGSIYMSVNDTDPGTFIGGTWEQIKDRFLLAAGDAYEAGSTGGEATHTLTVDEMANHRHDVYVRAQGHDGWKTYTSNDYGIMFRYSDTVGYHGPNYTAHSVEVTVDAKTGNNGGSQPHNNMPPYLAVYMWRRVA